VAPGTFEELESRVVITNGSGPVIYMGTRSCSITGDMSCSRAPTYFVFLGCWRPRGAGDGIEIDAGGMMRLGIVEDTLEGLGPGASWTGSS